MFEVRIYEQFIVALMTVTITSIGAISNLLVLLAIRKTSSMNGSFGIITQNQAICNIIICLIFLLFVVPVQLASSEFLIRHSHYFGTAALTVYEVSNGSHFLIALNRFCAVYLPHHYERMFSNSLTNLWRNILWIISIIFCICFYEIIDCNISYNPATWTFEFKESKLCAKLSWYSDFIFNTLVIIITLFLNLITAHKGRKQSRILVNSIGLKISKSHRRREWNFVKQTCFQGFSIFLGQFSYYIIQPVISDECHVFLFFIASLWAFMHAIEGGIILASNHELRAVFKKKSSEIFVIVRRPSGKLGTI